MKNTEQISGSITAVNVRHLLTVKITELIELSNRFKGTQEIEINCTNEISNKRHD